VQIEKVSALEEVMRKLCFLFVAASVLFVGCVSTNVQVDPSVEMNRGDLFYIARYGDDIGVYESIEEVFLDHGLNVESVYNAMSIPPAETSEVSGSGFYVAPDIIITNNHVLNGENEITYYQKGIKNNAVPIFTSEQNDIAILRGDPIDGPYFNLLSSSDYSVATPIFVLGYPLTDILGNEIRVTNGIINSMTGLGGDTNSVQISAPIQPGNSGGPVLNEDYEVVGVASSKLSDAYAIATTDSIAQNVNFAIKSDLVSFLASQYLSSDDVDYVDSLDEAINATVKIEAGGTELIPVKQYYIDFSYNATWDVFHWTLSRMNMTCVDVETGAVVADAKFSGSSFYSAATIAKNLTHELIGKLYGSQEEPEIE